MPTGYTAEVGDGKVTAFPDFALTCARGFGALVMLRDSDQSLEATKRYIAEGAYLNESRYYAETLQRARTRLAEVEAMTDAEAVAAAKAAADEMIEANRAHAATKQAIQERYEAMLAQVESWNPPTPDHENFKKFMVDQLTESIRFDCSPFEMDVPEIDGWREREVEKLRREIERSEREIEEERARNASRAGWITALLDSLECVPA